jgi:hypothetical protein
MEDVGIFMAILSILRPKCISHGHLEHFVLFCIFFSRFGMLYREKSGNLVDDHEGLMVALSASTGHYQGR